MQNPYKNLDRALYFSRNQVFCLKTSSSYPTFPYFLLKLCARFLLTNVYKSMCRIFLNLFRSWIINKNIKNECVKTRSFALHNYYYQIIAKSDPKKQFYINHASHLKSKIYICYYKIKLAYCFANILNCTILHFSREISNDYDSRSIFCFFFSLQVSNFKYNLIFFIFS